ncbi:MAG TPA: phosphoribosylanthranilate isomerase [bacterium]
MTYVKVCGIKTAKDALWALECGADALGFVFYRKSPRFIDPNSVRKITVKLPPDATTVGVFVNESAAFIRETLKITGIKIAQLHGEELPELLEAITAPTIKGIRIKNKSDLEQMKNYKPFAFLLDSKTDSYGGSGLSFDWGLAKKAKRYGRIIIAGGLTPDNVSGAINLVKPYGVDASSSVESAPGKKDKVKIRDFIRAVRQTENLL